MFIPPPPLGGFSQPINLIIGFQQNTMSERECQDNVWNYTE